MPSNFMGLSSSGYQDMTAYGAFRNVGQSIQDMPSGGSNFVRGMKLGYAAEAGTVGVFMAYHDARRQRNIIRMQAELIDLQTKALDTAADDAMRAGYQQAASIGFQAGQAKASQRASMGASGLQVGVGSSARVLTSTDIAKEMSVNQVMANAVTESFGYRRQAANSRSQALAVRASANQIKPWAAALSQLVGSAMMGFEMFGGSSGGGGGGGSFDFSSIASMFGSGSAG